MPAANKLKNTLEHEEGRAIFVMLKSLRKAAEEEGIKAIDPEEKNLEKLGKIMLEWWLSDA